jgi:hypothetical protein
VLPTMGRCWLILALACAVVSVTAACSPTSPAQRGASPTSSSAASSSTASRPSQAETSRITIDIPEPGGAVAAFGSVWVESKPERSLWRIGPDGRVLARIRGVARNPGRYGPFQTLAHGFGSIWTLTRRAVVRIDPATNAPQDRIPVQSPVSIVTGLGAVWVAGGRGAVRLLRIDPSDDTETVLAGTGTSAAGLGVGFGQIWWINFSEASSISAIEPTSGTERYVQTPLYVSFIVPSSAGLWLIDRGGQITMMSPDSLRTGMRRPVADQVMGVDLSEGTIWLNTGDLVGLDVATGKKTFHASVPGGPSPEMLAGVAKLGRRVWVVDVAQQQLVGIGLRTTTS